MTTSSSSQSADSVPEPSTGPTTPYFPPSRLKRSKLSTCFIAAIKHDDGQLYLHGYARRMGTAGIGVALGRARQYFRFPSSTNFRLGRKREDVTGAPEQWDLEAFAESLKTGMYGVSEAIVVPTTNNMAFRCAVFDRKTSCNAKRLGDITLWAETESIARDRTASDTELARRPLCDDDGQLLLLMNKTCSAPTDWTRVQPDILFHSVFPATAYIQTEDVSLLFAIDDDESPGPKYAYGLLSGCSLEVASRLERAGVFGIAHDYETLTRKEATARTIRTYVQNVLPPGSTVEHIDIPTFRAMSTTSCVGGRALWDARYLMLWEASKRATEAWFDWSHQGESRDRVAAQSRLRPLLGRNGRIYMLDRSS